MTYSFVYACRKTCSTNGVVCLSESLNHFKDFRHFKDFFRITKFPKLDLERTIITYTMLWGNIELSGFTGIWPTSNTIGTLYSVTGDCIQYGGLNTQHHFPGPTSPTTTLQVCIQKCCQL